jgi:hypothetical protein
MPGPQKLQSNMFAKGQLDAVPLAGTFLQVRLGRQVIIWNINADQMAEIPGVVFPCDWQTQELIFWRLTKGEYWMDRLWSSESKYYEAGKPVGEYLAQHPYHCDFTFDDITASSVKYNNIPLGDHEKHIVYHCDRVPGYPMYPSDSWHDARIWQSQTQPYCYALTSLNGSGVQTCMRLGTSSILNRSALCSIDAHTCPGDPYPSQCCCKRIPGHFNHMDLTEIYLDPKDPLGNSEITLAAGSRYSHDQTECVTKGEQGYFKPSFCGFFNEKIIAQVYIIQEGDYLTGPLGIGHHGVEPPHYCFLDTDSSPPVLCDNLWPESSLVFGWPCGWPDCPAPPGCPLGWVEGCVCGCPKAPSRFHDMSATWVYSLDPSITRQSRKVCVHASVDLIGGVIPSNINPHDLSRRSALELAIENLVQAHYTWLSEQDPGDLTMPPDHVIDPDTEIWTSWSTNIWEHDQGIGIGLTCYIDL